ncbi:hypothetical protein jhhlp_005911 [Lomentospora prolificans]|uniref:Uncharacterized protein n=1 Tax=Lomentospora prolificans TaxID=41688 RepID=A0A2N3N4F4_9PEZI|nr:hypothetical protein jhhlp_005911 [Lomentospora prolificans]
MQRHLAKRFKVGDKVWLWVKNYSLLHLLKKLDWLHYKYMVIVVLSASIIELDIPGNIYKYFNVDLLQ